MKASGFFWLVLAGGCRGEAPRHTGPVVPSVQPTPPVTAEPTPPLPEVYTTPGELSDASLAPDQVAAAAEIACPKVARPYFWRVEKAGRGGYILGTRHLSISATKLPAVVREAFTAAPVTVFETDANDPPRQPSDLFLTAASPDLSTLVGEARWARFVDLLGPEAPDLARVKPPIAAITLMASYEHRGAALDAELQAAAVAAGKPVLGLETHAFQNDLITKLLDVRALKAQIDATDDRRELFTESFDDIRDYCLGQDDEPGLSPEDAAEMRSVGYTDAELAALDDVLLYRRNDAWIPLLEQHLATDGVFIAVGADHTRGERGVIRLLAKRGYTVTRLGTP